MWKKYCIGILSLLPLLFGGCLSHTAFLDAVEMTPLPVLMYHSILKDSARAGLYVVSPDTFRGDLAYLREQGFESVVMADLIAYTQKRGDLPDKPVMITLDDGHYNNLTYVLPILREFNMKAVISVVGAYTETYSESPDPNPNYAYLTWEDIKKLEASGHVEIQNHSYDMHGREKRDGSKRKSGESREAYREAFCADAMRLQALLDRNCGVVATTYTYPYGQISPETREYLEDMGFCASLTCYEKCNWITRDPTCLFGLGRYNRPAGLSREEYMAKLLKGAQ